MNTKTFESDLQIDPESREVVAVISTDTVDRDGEVVLPSGLQRKQYGGNPIVLYGHDSNSLPIGNALWIKSDKNKLIAKYRISDKTQLARDVFGLMQDGVLRAHSIGFLDSESSPPTTKELEERPDWKSARRVVRQWELLEFSVVPIPCNPDCLAMAVAKCAPETRQFLGKAWEPRAFCCQWDEEDRRQTEENVEVACNPEENLAVKEVSQPRYSRSLKSIEQRLDSMMKDRLSVDEIIARLTGKA